MAADWEEEFEIEVEFLKFLGQVVDRTETTYEKFDTEAAETQAEVLDQTISLLRSMKECCNLNTRDKEYLDSIAGASVDVLSVLRCRTIISSTVAADSVMIDKETRKNPGRPSLKIQRRRVRERLLMYHEYQIRIKMESFAFVLGVVFTSPIVLANRSLLYMARNLGQPCAGEI